MLVPDFYEEQNLDHDLIIYLCLKVKGIGKGAAGHIASYLDTAASFASCTSSDLQKIVRKSGKPVFSQELSEEIIRARDFYLPRGTTDLRQMWITALIRDFVQRALTEIEQTDFNELLINPFLIRAFNFTDHKEVITFCFYQKVTRSIVTSWGYTVERMLLVSGGTPIKGGGFDIRVDRAEAGKPTTAYYLQIKSSPNTMDFDQVQNLNNNIRKLEDSKDKIGMLGVTYGVKSSHLSSIMQVVIGYPERVLVGHELWDFVAEQKGYAQEVLEWASAGLPQSTNFSEILEQKRLTIIKEWEAMYGTGPDSITKVLNRYL